MKLFFIKVKLKIKTWWYGRFVKENNADFIYEWDDDDTNGR